MNKQLKKLRKKQNCTYQSDKSSSIGYLFILPSLIGVCIFFLIPFVDVFKRSFSEGMSKEFVGIKNYVTVINNEAFLLAGKNTLKFVFICIPLLLVFSLVFGILVSKLKQKGEIYKTAFLIPLAVPVASIVLIWKFIFHKNGFLSMASIWIKGNSIDFMNTDLAIYVLVISYLWKNIGYDMILWIAGLSNISQSLYEAASIDGAGRVKQFIFITLPNLKNIFFTIFVLSLINSFKVFREAYLIGGNYPHTSMYMLQHLFNNWFISLDIEKLCAGAVIMSFFIIVLIGCFKKALNNEDIV